MAEASGLRRAFKYGCGGCLALVAVAVVAAVVLAGVAKMRARNEKVESRILEPATPGPAAPTPAPVPAAAPQQAEKRRPGLVVLDLQHTGFTIEPGDRLRVDASYDQRTWELVEELDENPEGETGPPWTYRVKFHRTTGWAWSSLIQAVGGTSPRVRIMLPRDQPLRLEVRVEQGAVEAQLGGLWLTAADVQLTQGGFLLDIAEPLREPMESLSIRGSMGGLDAKRIGNASPAILTVNYSMGGMALDLSGAWRRDAQITLDVRMAGSEVRLPRDVRIEGVDTGRLELDPQEEIPRPVLRFDVSSQRGGIEFK